MTEEACVMKSKIVKEKTDLTYLKWSHARSSSGTAGTFLKSESVTEGRKIYYKLSNFDSLHGVVGHECVNEIIVDRLLEVLGVPHLSYELINAEIEIDGKIYNTYLAASEDFKQPGESKTALDNYYRVNAKDGETPYEFCVRNRWRKYIDTMIAVDYLILNQDRHGANIEVLRNSRKKTIRLAPLFDHGLSLLYSCINEKEIKAFDIIEDKRCQNFIGGYSCFENLGFIKDKGKAFSNELSLTDRAYIFEDLEGIISKEHIDRSWNMIYERYKIYESL